MAEPLAKEVSQYCGCDLVCLANGGISFLRQKLKKIKRLAKKGKGKFSLDQINEFEKRAEGYLGMTR